MKHPKLRDSKRLLTNELYSIGDIPSEYIVKIGGHVVYLIPQIRNRPHKMTQRSKR